MQCKGLLAEILHLFQAFHYFSLLVSNTTNYTVYVLHPNVHTSTVSMVSLSLSFGIILLQCFSLQHLLFSVL